MFVCVAKACKIASADGENKYGNAFFGPSLWDKSELYQSDKMGVKFEYLDVDDFLNENGLNEADVEFLDQLQKFESAGTGGNKQNETSTQQSAQLTAGSPQSAVSPSPSTASSHSSASSMSSSSASNHSLKNLLDTPTATNSSQQQMAYANMPQGVARVNKDKLNQSIILFLVSFKSESLARNTNEMKKI